MCHQRRVWRKRNEPMAKKESGAACERRRTQARFGHQYRDESTVEKKTGEVKIVSRYRWQLAEKAGREGRIV